MVKRVLHHIIRIQLVNLIHDHVDVPRERIGKEQEFRPRQRLEARKSELVRFEVLEPGRRGAGDWIGVGRRMRGTGSGIFGC